MNENNVVTLVIAILISFGIYSLSTDEYEVNEISKCIEYSKITGNCINETSNFYCTSEHNKGRIFQCGEDLLKCTAKCKEYEKSQN